MIKLECTDVCAILCVNMTRLSCVLYKCDFITNALQRILSLYTVYIPLYTAYIPFKRIYRHHHHRNDRRHHHHCHEHHHHHPSFIIIIIIIHQHHHRFSYPPSYMTLSLASLSTIPLWWLCPESVKWLYSAGKGEQGREILEKLAQQKGVKLPDSIELDLPKDEPKTDGADEKLLLEEKNGGGGKVQRDRDQQ